MTDRVLAVDTARARSPLRAVVSRPLPAGEQIGVAIVDRMPLFREGLSIRVLRDPGMRLAGVAGHADPAVLLRKRLAVDVLVLDSVIDPQGELVHRLTEINPDLAVVVLVREPYRTSRYLAVAQAAGARGLVQHCAPPERIMDAIRHSRTAGHYLDPTLDRLATGVSAPPRSSSGRPLSRREDEVLRLIADGYSNQAIADHLVVSVETVRTHIKSMLRKLSARDRAHAVSLAFRNGLLTVDGGEPAEVVDVTVPQARAVSIGPRLAMN
jgi:DNA-binding NarL/FixJ family response regulator